MKYTLTLSQMPHRGGSVLHTEQGTSTAQDLNGEGWYFLLDNLTDWLIDFPDYEEEGEMTYTITDENGAVISRGAIEYTAEGWDWHEVGENE